MTTSRDHGTARVPSSTQLGSAWRARILVVDDEPALAELIDHTLRIAGFDSVTAGSRQEALTLAREHSPELALLDVMLPDGSGFELCRQLRALLPTMAVIFITAKDSLADKLTGLNLGGDDYITKPFAVTEVRSPVSSVV